MGLVYKLYNIKTNRIYKGQTKRALKERINGHFNELKHSKHYNKLGGMYSDKLYNQTDNLTINEYNRFQLIKYNKEKVLQESTLQKFSNNNKGSNNPYYNRMKYTSEFINQLRKEHEEGNTYVSLGKKHNIDVRLIIQLIVFGKTTNKRVGEYKKEKRAERRKNKNGYN